MIPQWLLMDVIYVIIMLALWHYAVPKSVKAEVKRLVGKLFKKQKKEEKK